MDDMSRIPETLQIILYEVGPTGVAVIVILVLVVWSMRLSQKKTGVAPPMRENGVQYVSSQLLELDVKLAILAKLSNHVEDASQSLLRIEGQMDTIVIFFSHASRSRSELSWEPGKVTRKSTGPEG